jgi:large repetitive protein
MKNFILFFCFFFLFLGSNSFFSQTKLDYDHDTRWFWGFNTGITWHTTDVNYKTERGWGLTLGKSFNYGYGKALSFDLRSRFLYGEWMGQNYSKTDTNIVNNALSSKDKTPTTNYKDSLGFYLLNFKNKLYSVDLELVMHANGLRERSNWDLYAFGGVGIVAFKSYGDLLDANKKMYDYGSLESFSSSSLTPLLDKKYETYLDGTSKAINYYIMPSLGVGLGYQLFRNISLGVEHRTTFARVDHFDGYNNPKASKVPFVKNGNDVFHYTSAYIRFQLHRGKAKPVQTDNPVDATPLPIQRIPEINFTNPANSGTTVTAAPFNLRANINYIDNRENINFKHNGVYTESFSYNNTTKKFESNVILFPGQNIFEIVASNAYGSDQKNTIIIFNEPQLALPVVMFRNPGSSPYNTSSSSIQIAASVLNVKDRGQINVLVNGLNITNFSFNSVNSQLTFPVNLTIGTNIITISGNNQSGSDSKTTSIIYNPVVQEPNPQVYFVDPSRSPFSTNNVTFNLDAEVLNVQGKENITFKQNGNLNQNFTYNPFNHDFQSNVVLVPGQNVFEIIATNSSGVAQATTILIYEKQAPRPPVVTITNPMVSPTQTPNEFFSLTATVLNVEAANQVNVLMNNQVQNFNFNPNSRIVSTTLALVEGQNLIQVTGTNNDGTDTKQTILIYRKANVVSPPLVTFTNPVSNPLTVSSPNQTITALVMNVDNNADINVSVNGTIVTNFSFSPTTKIVSFQRSLLEGANLISVTGTNSAGTDSKSATIIYRKSEVILPPTVNFIDPHTNPTTVYNQNYSLTAIVSGVQNSQNIQVKINGVQTSNFTYNNSTERVTLTSSLLSGANIFEISASNAGGSDSKSTTIIYKASEPFTKASCNNFISDYK